MNNPHNPLLMELKSWIKVFTYSFFTRTVHVLYSKYKRIIVMFLDLISGGGYGGSLEGRGVDDSAWVKNKLSDYEIVSLASYINSDGSFSSHSSRKYKPWVRLGGFVLLGSCFASQRASQTRPLKEWRSLEAFQKCARVSIPSPWGVSHLAIVHAELAYPRATTRRCEW